MQYPAIATATDDELSVLIAHCNRTIADTAAFKELLLAECGKRVAAQMVANALAPVTIIADDL